MPLPVAHLTHLALPTELLFNILAHVLAHSVHMVVVSPHDVEWHLGAHHTLSAVCFVFREIVRGISAKAFQFPGEDSEGLAPHVHNHLTALRALGAAIRHPDPAPSLASTLAISALDPAAPQLVQCYSLYITTVYLRTQAARSTPAVYTSTTAAIVAAVRTLAKVLYTHVKPRGAAAVLSAATADEAALSALGGAVVGRCGVLAGVLDELAAQQDSALALAFEHDEEPAQDAEAPKTKVEHAIRDIAAATPTSAHSSAPLPITHSLPLRQRRQRDADPLLLPAWLAQLPDVAATLQRLCAMAPALIGDDARRF
ncbi:hypothetical protein B0H17DRAFT_1219304 [Mycena rosella]|uniref:F-box domain-containing protein n=1 Tax=Mycena rosella TaxID=1033263 RepID=A0AAD7BIF2_MYCRO|nr:hypothetical protein B0H17DRAFT_1219304 [Mycena rosella]